MNILAHLTKTMVFQTVPGSEAGNHQTSVTLGKSLPLSGSLPASVICSGPTLTATFFEHFVSASTIIKCFLYILLIILIALQCFTEGKTEAQRG